MRLTSWIDTLKRRFSQPRDRRSNLARRSRRHQPVLVRIESLETRTWLAVVFWDGGGADSNWQNAANWRNDVLPGVGGDVTIDVTGDVTIGNVCDSINSLNSVEGISITGGTLNIVANSSVQTLSPNGTLTESGHVGASRMYEWTTYRQRVIGVTVSSLRKMAA